MREKLKALSELQKVDVELAALKKAADTYPKQLAELDKELAVFHSAVESEKARVLDLDTQKRTLEQTIQDDKDKVKKWEARLADQRSTREYAALAREIDIAKKANQTMGDESIQLGVSLGAARESLKARTQEYAAKQDQLAGRMAELKQQLAAVDAQAQALESKRQAAAAGVDSNLLRKYDVIRKKRMPALVGLLMPGTCQGCNMNVPPQLYNTLRTTAGTDICPSCNRIIYAAEVTEEKTE